MLSKNLDFFCGRTVDAIIAFVEENSVETAAKLWFEVLLRVEFVKSDEASDAGGVAFVDAGVGDEVATVPAPRFSDVRPPLFLGTSAVASPSGSVVRLLGSN